ncbi:hypothetical protein BGZ83_004411 [Gryganskiella cystojenkinii]|nr:hypothetical protein BGZ83_004411 [Gryganskiella cystojenkinii]
MLCSCARGLLHNGFPSLARWEEQDNESAMTATTAATTTTTIINEQEAEQGQRMPLSPRPQSRYSQQSLVAPVLDNTQQIDATAHYDQQHEYDQEHEADEVGSSGTDFDDSLEQRDPFASHELSSPPPPEPVDGPSDTEEAVLLPPNWSATTNPQGRIYYYNVLTKETSWKFPTAPVATSRSIQRELDQSAQYAEALSPDGGQDDADEEPLPEGWNSAQDEDGSQYFFNETTGEATWDRPMSPEFSRGGLQSPGISESSSGLLDSSSPLTTAASQPGISNIPRSAPKRQSSIDENMLQSQLLGLSLTDEELHALELNQLPPENIQRKGSLRVKSQKVSTNATISSWKDYWVVVYKGFLLFYRDDSGSIKHAYSLKSSTDSMSKFKHATQVKPSGCFDSEKIAVDIPAGNLTKKKNVFTVTPGTSVRLLMQDASGAGERVWVKDIKTSLESRQADELSGSVDPYLIQILKRQTSGGGDTSGLKMNKKIEEKDLKVSKNPLKPEKGRGIRSMVAQGIHVPRRKSAQDEKLKLPIDSEVSVPTSGGSSGAPSSVSQTTLGDSPKQQQSGSGPIITYPKRKSSRDQSKEGGSGLSSTAFPSFRKDHPHSQSHPDFNSEQSLDPSDASSPGSSSHHGAKAKLTNMSRNFFSKDKEKDKDKDRDEKKVKDKDAGGKEKDKEKKKDKVKDRYRLKERDSKKDFNNASKSLQGSSSVFGGSLIVESGRTVPKVVELCVKTIEDRGLLTAGIYRVSGHMASIQKLKRAFNEGLDVAQLVEKEPDINTVAALLKLYFRELREPLMVYDFYPLFIAAADMEDYNEKLYRIKELVHSLPEANFNTLEYLMAHLGRIQDQYETTKMDSANLAICFAPNLLRQEVDDISSIINTGKQSSIIDTLIEQREWVFDPYPVEEDDEGEDDAGEEGGEGTEETEDTTLIRDQAVYGEDLKPHESSRAAVVAGGRS